MIERNQIACVLDYILTFRLNNNGHYCNYMRETGTKHARYACKLLYQAVLQFLYKK